MRTSPTRRSWSKRSTPRPEAGSVPFFSIGTGTTTAPICSALEEGFLKAENRGDLKFALMWANHDWLDIHPAQRSRPCNVLATGKVSVRQFEEATDYILEHYFTQPNYWRVDGGLYFSIYELAGLVQGLGGVAGTRAALDGLRDRVRKRGLGELHLNAVIWGVQILPAEIRIENPNALLEALGFDSVTSYV